MNRISNSTCFEAARAKAQQMGVFRTRDMVAAGYPREYLRRLVQQKEIRQLSRGLYSSATFEGDQNQSLVAVAKRVPRGVICLFSALQFHGIGTQSPHETWIALPRGTNVPHVTDLPVRFCRFSEIAHTCGIEEHQLSGGAVRIYSAAKTVADCFKYRQKYGLDVAIEALREGWRQKKIKMNDLSAAAAACRVSRVMQPYLEMLT